MNEWQLFDLQTDKAELNNLAGKNQYKQLFDKMKQLLLDARNLYDDHEPAGELQ